MATAHLVHGYLGAGKTTFARQLVDQVDGVLLSLDEWYLRLFAPGEPTAELDAAALERLWGLLDDHWPRLVELGLDVVLDFGFWTRESRDNARALAEGAGAVCRLYWVQVDDATALETCLRRNTDASGSFLIEGAAYDALRHKFEPLGPDEPHDLVVDDGCASCR